MIHKIFTIHDQAAAAYLPPFILPTNGMAARTFTNCVHDTNHRFSQNPEDYTLFELGTFSDTDATFAIHNTPQKIVNGLEAKAYDPPVSHEAPILRDTKGADTA